MACMITLMKLLLKKMKEHLVEDKDSAFSSRDLATIRRDAPVEISLADLTYLAINKKNSSRITNK